jgi:hypothetical protein
MNKFPNFLEFKQAPNFLQFKQAGFLDLQESAQSRYGAFRP